MIIHSLFNLIDQDSLVKGDSMEAVEQTEDHMAWAYQNSAHSQAEAN
jgi:hypothetical protein